MLKTNTLDNILYKDKHYIKGASIEVDDRDVDKLISLGAIAGELIQPEIKINVIRNPIEPKEEIKGIKLDPKIINKIHKENKRIKRKYTKRSNDAVTSSKDRGIKRDIY